MSTDDKDDTDNVHSSIVAIHGLDGHWKRSWTDEASGMFWLQTFLPDAVPNARIYSYGYDANTHGSSPVLQRSIDDHALRMVTDLVRERRRTQSNKKPIIFVAHSLGGIVLKSALLHSHNATAAHLPDHRSIKISTYGIVFLGTPQQGVKGAEIANLILNIGSLRFNVILSGIQKQCRDYLAISGDFVTKCFYEARETPTLMGFHKMIVPRVSAVLPGAANVEPIAMNKNHLTMAKFSSEVDNDLRSVSDHIAFMTEDAPREVARTWDVELKKLAIGAKRRPLPFTVPFGRDEKFVVRQPIIDALKGLTRTDNIHRRIALVGRGGTGKTALAIEYAHMVQESTQCAVFWVHASNRARFEQSYREIADALELPGRDNPQQNILGLVEAWFKRAGNGNWLMILDNADDPKIFFDPESKDPETELLRHLPQSSNGIVLATTRYKRAAAVICEQNMIEVPPMTSAESGVLLEKMLDRRVQPMERCDEFLMELEYLPLAIAQAAAFITYNSVDINHYLQLLRENESSMTRLLTEPFADRRRDSQVPNSVIATLSLSFEQIKREDNNAVEVLSFMSVLDRQRIPQSLIKHAFTFNSLDLTKALGVLKSFYLILPNSDEESFDMHRLVQISTRSWLVSALVLQKWQRRALAVLAEAFPATGFQEWPERWPVCSKYLPHADVVLNYNTEEEEASMNKLNLLYRTAYYIHEMGNDKDAEARFRETVELATVVNGPDQLHTLSVLDVLGAIIRRRGRYLEAEAIHRHVMEMLPRVCGPDHPSMLACHGNLGNALFVLGRYDEAEKWHRRRLEGQSKYDDGHEFDHVEITLSDLANTVTELGRTDEAEVLRRAVVRKCDGAYGREHPKTLSALHNLGSILSVRGKLHEAIAILQLALQGREIVLGLEHPGTVATIQELGAAYLDVN
ncbi:hypothetical protein MMC30_002420 [Trapelia coarctata]|nr:hypothetical protein [Trapelia coarctata]